MGSRLAAATGPFYDTRGVATVLDVPDEAVEELRESGHVLAMQTSDGVWVYPVWQFAVQQVDPALLPAIVAFRNRPGWSAAVWFVTRHDDLDDLSPLDWARSGRPSGPVSMLAHHRSAEWT